MQLITKPLSIFSERIGSLTLGTRFIVFIISFLFLMSAYVATEKFTLLVPSEKFHVAYNQYNNRSTNFADVSPKELNNPAYSHPVNNVDIQFTVRLYSMNGYDNIFQTADENRGIRFEFDPVSSHANIIVSSRNDDHVVFSIPNRFQLNQDYRIQILIHNNQVKCFVNSEEVVNTLNFSLNYDVVKTVVGSGYSQRRPLDGVVSGFTMSYSASWETTSIKILKGVLRLVFFFSVILIVSHRKILSLMSLLVFESWSRKSLVAGKSSLAWYTSAITDFAKDAKYMLPLLFAAAIGFVFPLTHLSVGADDTCVDRYFDGGYLLAQNRVTGYLVNQILHVYAVKPFVPDFLCVVLLVLSALIFCAVFKKASRDKLHPLTYTIFSCIYVSYPLIFEIFIVMGANLNICLGYALTSVSLIFALEFLESKRINHLLKASVLLYFALSCYESFAPVYLCALTSLLVLKYLFGESKDKQVGRVLINGSLLFLVLLIALSMYKIVSMILIPYIHLPNYAATGIAWSRDNIYGVFTELWKGITLKFILSGFIFQPITSLVIAIVGCILLAVLYLVKYKRVAIILILLAMLLSLISLSILQGYATFYRSCQVFSFFTGFILSLAIHHVLTSRCRKIFKSSALILISILVFRQANDLNNWFFVDYMRSEEEKTMANLIAYQVKAEYDTLNKPVIFTGGNGISENINSYLIIKPETWNGKIFNVIASSMMGHDMSGYKFVEGDMVPIYGWAIGAFGEVNAEVLKYFRMNGHTFKQGSVEMFLEAIETSKYKPAWPAKGSIYETPTYIVVHI